jgi:hypothetical protein
MKESSRNYNIGFDRVPELARVLREKGYETDVTHSLTLDANPNMPQRLMSVHTVDHKPVAHVDRPQVSYPEVLTVYSHSVEGKAFAAIIDNLDWDEKR